METSVREHQCFDWVETNVGSRVQALMECQTTNLHTLNVKIMQKIKKNTFYLPQFSQDGAWFFCLC